MISTASTSRSERVAPSPSSWTGRPYEIDLSAKNGTVLRKVLAPYVAAGRQLKNSRGVRVKRTQIGSDGRTIKEWARANGYEVKDRGRIPNDIREAFEAAN